MAYGNRIQTNFARGEISPDVMSRGDIDVYGSALRRCKNFIPKFQGPAKYSPGTTWIEASSVASGSVMVPFVYRDTQAYMLELFVDDDELNMRVFKDDGAVQLASGWVAGDSTAIGFPSGNPDYVSSVAGDVIVTTTSSVYSASDLQIIKYAQSGDAMIIVSEGNFCIQIWRGASAEDAWAINEAKIRAASWQLLTTLAAHTDGYLKVTKVAHGLLEGDSIIIVNSDPTNDYNGTTYVKEYIDADNFVVGKQFIGNARPTNNNFTKAGSFHDFTFMFENITDFITTSADIPKEAKFNEGRLYFALADKLYGSASVVDGQNMYVTFHEGAEVIPTDGIEFTLAVSSDKPDLFNWLKVSNKSFFGGMENMITSISGNPADEPIAADSIRILSAEDRGTTDVAAIEDGKDIIFVGSTGKQVNAFRYNFESDSQKSVPLTMLVEHFFDSTVKRMAFQRGLSDIVWVLLANGKLYGFIYNSSENITGWFEYSDGNGDVYSDLVTVPASNGIDRVWVTVARPDGAGSTADQIEQVELETSFYKLERFFTGKADKAEDLRKWKNAVYEQQKHAVHMHSMMYSDAFETSETAGEYLHVHATAGVVDYVYISLDGTLANKLSAPNTLSVAETAGKNIIIKASSAGLGEGIFQLDDYDAPTDNAEVTVLKDIADYTYSVAQDSYVVAPGDWAYSFSSITSASLQRYYDSSTLADKATSGVPIDVVLDGGYIDEMVIEKDGADYTIDLGNLYGCVLYIGYKYTGILHTLPTDVGGRTGTAFSKLKNIDRVHVDLIDTISMNYGPSLYEIVPIDFRHGDDIADRPPPPFTGTYDAVTVNGNWDHKQGVVVIQDVPVPCTVSAIDIYGEASDEV